MFNPLNNAVNAFLAIWNNLPLPLRSLFYVGLVFALTYALYTILSR